MSADWGSVPEPPGDYEPAVVDWLVGADAPTPLALPVTVVDLARRGVLSLSWTEEGLCVRRRGPAPSPWQALVHELLFQRAGRDEDVSAEGLRAWLAARPEPARRWAVDWELALTQHALATLRAQPPGLLRRRRRPRDQDALRERWQDWAAQLSERALVQDTHPDALAFWARALVLCLPLGCGEAVAERLDRRLSPSERAALAGQWCPALPEATLAESLRAVVDALPAVPVAADEADASA